MMVNQVFKFVTLVLLEKETIDNISLFWKDYVRDALEDYTDPNSDYFKELKSRLYTRLGKMFANKRDAIRWYNNYGYDCANEDITIFLAAYIKLSKEYNDWKANGETGDEPFTVYKVYISPDSNEKTLIQLTFTQLDEVYTMVRNSQLEAYLWLNTERSRLDGIANWDELMMFMQELQIDLESLIV